MKKVKIQEPFSQDPSTNPQDLHHAENENTFGLMNLTSLGNVSGLSSFNSPRNANRKFDTNFVIEEQRNETDEPPKEPFK